MNVDVKHLTHVTG